MAPFGRRESWFRSSSGTKIHDINGDSKDSPGNTMRLSLVSHEEMELEYLNEISKLTLEKEEARDEIERQAKENDVLNASLRESNDTLSSKVSELEAKLVELDKVALTPGKYQSEMPPDSDAKDLDALRALRAKLAQYDKSNRELNAKLQKWRQRRAEGDDVSDITSIGSYVGSVSSLNNRQHLFNLQRKYEDEVIRNNKLEQKLRTLEINKENAERMLEELKAKSSMQSRAKNDDMVTVKRELSKAKYKLHTLGSFSTEDVRDDIEQSLMDEMEQELDRHKRNYLRLEQEVNDKKEEIKGLQSKLQEERVEKKKLQDLHARARQLEEETNKKSKYIELLKDEKEENLSRLRSLEALLSQHEGSNEHTTSDELLKEETIKLKHDILLMEEKISVMSDEIKKLHNEKDTANSSLSEIETTLAETKLKNAQLMEKLEELEMELKHEKGRVAELERSVSSGNLQPSITSPTALNKMHLNKIAKLQGIVSEKENKLKVLESELKSMVVISKKLEELEKQLGAKKEEIAILQKEKLQSSQRLETIESDFLITQTKGAKTWEELEELKEQFEQEKKMKLKLQHQLVRKDSIENLVDETKKLSEAALKDKDVAIEKLKRQLTEANVARAATEKKLIGVMNDSVAQESSRALMRQELEDQLEEENERAIGLEALIKEKEEDIEKVRKEFNNLAKTMQTEMEKKRIQITELNGEVLEKSNNLSEKDREIQYLKSEMDDMELRHMSEVNRLHLDMDASVNKLELDNLQKQNTELQNEILSLNQEVGKLRAMFVNQPLSGESSEASVKILRARNEKLKKHVEKLTLKLNKIQGMDEI